MKMSRKLRSFIFFLLVIAGMFLAVAYDLSTKMDQKRKLPLCTPDTSLYLTLAAMGEQLFGVGNEESKLALERKGLGIAFTLNPKTGNWSFLNTDRTKKTCFVAMGKKWHRTNAPLVEQRMWKKSEGKKVGYSASFKKMTEELSKEGKAEIGFGKQDLDLIGTPLLEITTHLFTDGFGLFTAVTSTTYRVNGKPLEVSSIDATGSDWNFHERYENYPLN